MVREMAALRGKRVCIVFESSLLNHTRLLREIEALRSAGATVEVLSSSADGEGIPDGCPRTCAPPALGVSSIAPSQARWRPARIISNTVRNVMRFAVGRDYTRTLSGSRIVVLEEIARRVDVFWVINFHSLPAVVQVAESFGKKVVYEVLDLVAEYTYWGRRSRRRSLDAERRFIRRVDGLIVACDGYADYYLDRLGDTNTPIPVVVDNMPPHLAAVPAPTKTPLRLLFLGNLMFDRPIIELIEALALAKSQATLTLQGRNDLGEAPERRITALGLGSRVQILAPCTSQELVLTAQQYDVGVVALRGLNENERRATTSKLLTYAASGLAVLGSDLPGIAGMVREAGCGLLVDGTTPATWADAIDRISSLSIREIDAMKFRALAAARARNWSTQQTDFIAEFVRVLRD